MSYNSLDFGLSRSGSRNPGIFRRRMVPRNTAAPADAGVPRHAGVSRALGDAVERPRPLAQKNTAALRGLATRSGSGKYPGTTSRPGGTMPKETVTITDHRTGKSYELPITDGTIRATDLRQIKVDDQDFGLMTYDPGFMNTSSCRSAITYIDG